MHPQQLKTNDALYNKNVENSLDILSTPFGVFSIFWSSTMDQQQDLQINLETDIQENDKEISFSWIERDDDDIARRGTMYCFKSCSVNAN